MYSGSCLCQKVQFEIHTELDPIQICHCSQCRKAQGSAFVTNIPVSKKDLLLLSGEDALSFYESSPGKHRVFCKHCGSPIYSETKALPGVVRIRAGSLNGELHTQPGFHIFYDSKANWFDINDNLPKFSSLPEKPKLETETE